MKNIGFLNIAIPVFVQLQNLILVKFPEEFVGAVRVHAFVMLGLVRKIFELAEKTLCQPRIYHGV